MVNHDQPLPASHGPWPFLAGLGWPWPTMASHGRLELDKVGQGSTQSDKVRESPTKVRHGCPNLTGQGPHAADPPTRRLG